MDTIIRGLLLNKTVNIIAVSGKEMVEKARETHELSREIGRASCRERV